MTTCELTVNVEVKRRSVLGTIACLPRVFRGHYRLLRRQNGVIVSAYGAWLMSRLLVRVVTSRENGHRIR